MNSLYSWIVVIHIFSAIVGIGPGFILTTIVKSAKTLPEVRHAFFIKKKLHIFVMSGGMLLLVSGLLMGLLRPMLFQQGWYITSLILYFFALLLGPTALKRSSAPIKEMLADPQLTDVPDSYHVLVQRLLRIEYVENTLLLTIILLMVTKPF
ncbi:DUF2269 family protein [Gracilibacillus salinarum]|uniref:DUF2269 domain-containing protein n=1 Tax=Gracilibacillus salinarum TaxID=2932255 RepID=A0ABY4GKS7_9BACI|nr:DUF2269 family protein [Gracilibacillus salinarum]UOQ84970.1 DUF2269 domain-containing protein [Gracilibacillus salinarum]